MSIPPPVDVSLFLTFSNVSSIIANSLVNYVSSNSFNNTVNNFITTNNFTSNLSNYTTNTYVNFLFSNIPRSTLSNTYTVNTLPQASNNQAKYAFVTNLGGGADMVLSDGTYWKHIRNGVVTSISIANTITITPLLSPPIIQFVGNNFTGSSTVSILTSNLYPGYQVRFITPSGVLSSVTGLTGSIGVSVSGGTSLPLVGGTWEDLQWTGNNLIEIAKGTL